MRITNNCTGCMCCYNLCPSSAIKIAQDINGFYIPEIDSDKCVECGLCNKRCPSNSAVNNQNITKAYYGYYKNCEIVMNSSSGGMFSAIAEKVINDGGVVFGTRLDYAKNVLMYDHTDNIEINELRKSKYAESKVGEIFVKVKEMLNLNRKVLFCGTPCHVWGLKNFLAKEYDNLLTVDFACEGVPSIKYLQDYVVYREKKAKASMSRIDFRAKIYGWNVHSIKIDFEGKMPYKKIGYNDPYMDSFLTQNICRESCYNCSFNDNHCADIILADFWKYKMIENLDFNENNGLSLVLINSEKGQKIFDKLQDTCVLYSIDTDKASYNCIARKLENSGKEDLHGNYNFLRNNNIVKFYGNKKSLKYRVKGIIKENMRKIKMLMSK